MSGLVQIFVARAKLSGFRRRAHRIEGDGIDSSEAKLVTDAGEKNLAAPGIDDLTGVRPIPYQPVGMAQPAMSPAAGDQQRSLRRRRPWHGTARDVSSLGVRQET